MLSAKYHDGIRAAYQGELAGERLYRELANRFPSDDRHAKFRAIADVEWLTHSRLKPIAERLGVGSGETDWLPTVERRAAELGSLSWREFIDKALRDWPPYIERFAALKPLAPPGDEASIQFLIDHEVALVEFARLEQATPGAEDSLRVLQTFLGK
jgi:hypothetical protein